MVADLAQFVLLTSCYRETAPARVSEYRECLQRNLDCAHISVVHLLREAGAPSPVPEHSKLRCVMHRRRATFQDYFDYANRLPIGTRVIVANADIFFDESLGELNGYSLKERFLCLSRWDLRPRGGSVLFENCWSQDAWIFQTPISIAKCDFPLGIVGCDNRIAALAAEARLHVSNPARTVHATHLHLSGIRNYAPHVRIRGRYLAVQATELHKKAEPVVAAKPASPENQQQPWWLRVL